MRFSYFTSIALVGSALAAPAPQAGPSISAADIQFMQDGYAIIIKNGNKINNYLQPLKLEDDKKTVGGALQKTQALSEDTIKVTKDLIVKIRATPGTLDSGAVAALYPPSKQVRDSTRAIINKLQSVKDVFVKHNYDDAVYKDLVTLRDVTIDFVGAAKDKLAPAILNVAKGPFDELVQELVKGVNTFTK